MHREGDIIIFTDEDRNLVDFPVPASVHAGGAFRLYKAGTHEMQAIADELTDRMQRLGSEGERMVAHEAAHRRIEAVGLFQDSLGRLATAEIAAALADELHDSVYQQAA